MTSRKAILLSWSSGKDSAWSLHVLRQRRECEVVGLLTTINQAADRVAMHAVRHELLEAQAEAAGLPLWTIPLPWPCTNDHYEAAMSQACRRAVAENISGIAFGDLFLEDVRDYRIKQLASTGLEPIFPIWGLETTALAHEMISSGLRARLTCVDTEVLPSEFAGREFDDELLRDFENLGAKPAAVDHPVTGSSGRPIDPCGERGEFHSFCYAGPMFLRTIPIATGETVRRDRFVFADLTLVKGEKLKVQSA